MKKKEFNKVLNRAYDWDIIKQLAPKELKKEIIINSLSFKQAAKWILIHERRRHLLDIAGCDIDLANLKEVEIPAEAMELIDYHFVIPIPEKVPKSVPLCKQNV